MKYKLYIIFGLLFICNNSFSQTIVFKPYGDMEKPMPLIEIVPKLNDTLQSKWERRGREIVYIEFVDNETLKSIFDIVNSNRTQIKYDDKLIYDYGAYRIIANDKINIDYMLPSNKESFIFFNKILPFTKSNPNLEEELKALIKRLD